MISKPNTSSVVVWLAAVIVLAGCSSSPPPVSPEHLELEAKMKRMAGELEEMRESNSELEQLKTTIAALDSQIVLYRQQLEEKVLTTPRVVEVKPAPRDPDIINLRGNIYVLIREIDSLKQNMKNLMAFNDSLESAITRLSEDTNTQEETSQNIPEAPESGQIAQTDVISPFHEKAEKTVSRMETAPREPKGYRLNVDYRMAYNDALNKYFQKDYEGAIQAFQILIKKEPHGAYADNSQYWIGESYYSIEDYERAIAEFRKVFQFPENNKSDHALFKIAISYQKLGLYERARESMNQFVLEYPESELVTQAHEFLSENK